MNAQGMLNIRPELDITLFMSLGDLNRVEGRIGDILEQTWQVWLDRLTVRQLEDEGAPQGLTGRLVIFLDETVEENVDSSWSKSETEGWYLHNLAITMLMSVLREVMPQINELGCAPVPTMSPGFAEVLSGAGLKIIRGGMFERRYSSLTYYPFKGGCEVCALKENCPRKQSSCSGGSEWVLGSEED